MDGQKVCEYRSETPREKEAEIQPEGRNFGQEKGEDICFCHSKLDLISPIALPNDQIGQLKLGDTLPSSLICHPLNICKVELDIKICRSPQFMDGVVLHGRSPYEYRT